MGNWWIYSKENSCLKRLPNGREDIFSDRSIDVRAKRGLMKFLKFVIDFENQRDVWAQFTDTPLHEFLSKQFQLPESMQQVIGALTLSLHQPLQTTVAYSLPRIARHLTSIGVFGPGFGSVVPKWGGGAEIAQVSCRAGAVGGAVYVLGTGIKTVASDGSKLELSSGETVQSAYTVRSQDTLEVEDNGGSADDAIYSASKSVCIISSDLNALFKATVEGAPSGSVAVVAFPAGSLGETTGSQYPVYIMAHSSETGECPQNQCVFYASTRNMDEPQKRLTKAMALLLEACPGGGSTEDSEKPSILFELHYEQYRKSASNVISGSSCNFPSPSLDLAFDDASLDNVEEAWRRIMDSLAQPTSSYMTFKPREQFGDEDDE